MKPEEFEQIMTEFWGSHPISKGWSIETDLINNGMKVTIKRNGVIVLTTHKAATGDKVEWWERAAITQAISYLPKVSSAD